MQRSTPNTPDYELPTGFRLDAHLGRAPWELGDRDEPPVVAEVLFHFPVALWAERNRYGTLVERRADGDKDVAVCDAIDCGDEV